MAKSPEKTPPKKAAASKKPSIAKASAKKPAPKAKPMAEEAASVREQASTLFGQAGDRARRAANTGKDRATGAMGELASMVEDVAKTLDEKVGAQYGDYARKAASAVSGVADTLKSKEIDDLVDDARDFVRSRPAVAIGAAAAVGFLLTRLIKAGGDEDA